MKYAFESSNFEELDWIQLQKEKIIYLPVNKHSNDTTSWKPPEAALCILKIFKSCPSQFKFKVFRIVIVWE